VIARDAMEADALATAANVLAPAETLELVRSLPDVACLIVTAEGRVERSPGWGRFQADARVPDVADAPTPTPEQDAPGHDADWFRSSELVVNFEINAPEAEGRRYRRPYVAIWIEDQDGRPVRTLLLWVSMGGAGPFQWIPDLKRWYRADQLRKQQDRTELVFTIARPTRPPGKYRAVWDGKDDRGKPVPAGRYTLMIDAAREHGTYQNLRTNVTVGEQPFTRALEGGAEIRSAQVEYRAKPGRGANPKGNGR
jgi:hypothetical protein